jgi:hypothetical protein
MLSVPLTLVIFQRKGDLVAAAVSEINFGLIKLHFLEPESFGCWNGDDNGDVDVVVGVEHVA